MDYEIVSRLNKGTYKVSVIVPVYNVEAYLEETLSSLVNQTLDSIEILLIDDGSSDKSENVIRMFLNRFDSIVYVKQKNKGPGQARNVGIELAQGEYISFVDSDDLLPQDALERMYQAAVHEEAEVVTGISLSFNSSRTWYIQSHLDNGVYKPGSKTLIRNPELLYSLGPCNKLFSTSLIKDVQFPTEIRVTEDHPFVIEAYLRATKIFTVDHLIYKYRRREDDGNISLSQEVQVNALSVLRDVMKSLKASNPLWKAYMANPCAREATQAYYYNRIIWVDLWPALRRAVISKEEDLQKETFNIFKDWIKGLDAHFFNQITSLHHILTYEIVLRFAMLKSGVYPAYLELITSFSKLMDPGSWQTLERTRFKKEVRAVQKAYQRQSVRPLKRYVFASRFKKAKKIGFTFIKNATVRRVLYPIFKTLPVKKKVVFASNKRDQLGDSYEYLYNELRELRSDYMIKLLFKMTRSFWEQCQFYYDVATAQYIILEDYYRPFYNLDFRKETELIQMWHAAGAFKKFGFSSIGAKDSNTADFERKAHHFYTKVVVTSDDIVPKYAEAFHVPEKRVYPLGLPRTDLFFNKEKLAFIKESYLARYPLLRNKKIITYAPTFRGGPKERSQFTLHLDLKAMAGALSEHYCLILKMHPSVQKELRVPDEVKHFVINLSNDEMNHVLALTDILISDYSSLVFEYALLDRPMLFFAYDLDQYINERGFYYDYESFVPGPIVKTTEGIIQAIQQQKFDQEKIEPFRETFFNDLDGHAARRFVETLISE